MSAFKCDGDCGRPCGACAQAADVLTARLDVGMTLILGVVIGRETAALDQRVFPHLCAKHRRFFAMASNESRQRIEASAEIERLERETHPNLN